MNGHLQIKYKRGKLMAKEYTASALSDPQASIKALTLIAAKKQSLYEGTKLKAICDSANYCWKVINIIEPAYERVKHVLNWFHIFMKFKNIAIKNGGTQTNIQ